MAEFFFEYGLFLAKALTLVAAAGAVTLVTVGLPRKGGTPGGLTIFSYKISENSNGECGLLEPFISSPFKPGPRSWRCQE